MRTSFSIPPPPPAASSRASKKSKTRLPDGAARARRGAGRRSAACASKVRARGVLALRMRRCAVFFRVPTCLHFCYRHEFFYNPPVLNV